MIETSRNLCVSTVSAETAFPFKLHAVLDASEKQGFDDVISWQGNNAFMVHKPTKFENTVMKEYFNQTLYRSFQKQLELYGFKRLAVGERFGGSYTHTLFLRGKPNMGRFMITSQNIKKAKLAKSKLRRRSTAPVYRSTSQLHSPSTNSQHGRSISGSSGQNSSLSNEENFEPLLHDIKRIPSIIEYCNDDRRSTKKHRSNNSWSSDRIGRQDSTIVDWLSSAFGATETISGEEEVSIDDNEEDGQTKFQEHDIGSIHSFSSALMEETVSSTCLCSE